MSASDLPPPAVSPPAAPSTPVEDGSFVPPPPPAEWGAVPVGAPPESTARPGVSVGWSIAALVGCVLSMVGAFLPLVSVAGRSISRDDFRFIDVVMPWEFSDRYKGSLLFERWDIAFGLLFVGVIAGTLLLALRRKAWPAVVGVLVTALAFHLQLSMVQRAENRAFQVAATPTYQVGGIFAVAGAFLALVGFVAVLARRH